MNGISHKTIFKKLLLLLLLVCLISESVLFPSMSTVYASNNSANPDLDQTPDSILDDSTFDEDNLLADTVEDSTVTQDTTTQTEVTTFNKEDTALQEPSQETPSNADLNNSSDSQIKDDETSSGSQTSKDNTNDSITSDLTKVDELKISEEVFPDAIFRGYVETHFDTNKDKQLSVSEISKVESVDLSNMGIGDLTGIEHFRNILYLYCYGNNLTTLDVSSLVNLTVLDCSYNHLTSLDLSKCSSLISFEGSNNAYALTVDEENSFDLTNLKDFDILNSFNWSENVAISDNLLTFTPDSNTNLVTYEYLVQAPQLEDTYIDFSLVKSFDTAKELEINETNFPDEAFRLYIEETLDLNKDKQLSSEEILAVTYLFIPKKEIASLTGIEIFTNLVYLNFDDNAVTSINLNSLSNLRSVSCNNNQLEELLCNELAQLKSLYCNANRLYSLDLDGCISLNTLECKDNVYNITTSSNTIDLSKLSNLDLSRTSNWSVGTLAQDDSLLLEDNVILVEDNSLLLEDTLQTSFVTYTYLDQSPSNALEDITFTLEVSPDLENQDTSQIESVPESTPVPESETPVLPEQNINQNSVPAVTTAPVQNFYTITFYTDGGSGIEPQSILEQNKVMIPANPTKKGYLFDGWYLADTPYDFNAVVSSNITLTARWSKVSPAKPSIKSLKNVKKSKMKISLKKAKHVAGYEIAYSTSKKVKKNTIVVDTKKTSVTVNNLMKGKTYYVKVRSYSFDSTGEKVYSGYSKIKKLAIKKGLSQIKATATSSTIKSAKITNNDNVNISAKAKGIVKSSDNYYYLFSLPSYRKSIPKKAKPLDSTLKATSFQFNTPLNLDTPQSSLYSKFVVAVKTKSGYKIISKAKYITNPQKVADFTYAFPKASTKKGLQINASMINDVKDLGVKNSAFNIPLDLIIAAPGENNYRNGIDYEYNGETYWFRKGMIAAYDSLFRKLERQDIVVTAIVLLGWRDDLTYLITPSGREEGHNYYNFNTSNAAARKQLEATFSFLAERYASGDQQGKVVNWIIGNEINSFDAWNYAGTKSLSKYTQLYADSYRLAYTAMKSVYSNVRLYVSLDQCWNISNSSTFSGKEFLQKFDSYLKEYGDISWNLAYHAYPSPLTDPRFWKNANGLSENNEDSPMISIHNLSVLTKYIKKHYGKSTRIILSEQGFTSASPYGEKTQAAAMAYAYYLAEFNSMIDAFILSRHVDNIAETQDGLNLGLWSNIPGYEEQAYRKKYAWKIYKYMDTPSSTNVTKFALKKIGAKNWKKVVPNYKAKKFKSMPNAN